MSIICRCTVVILMVLAGAQLSGQERSTAGTDFWFGFMQNLDASLESSLEIFITAAQPASGTIEVPGREAVNFQVLPGETFKYEVASERNNPFAASGSERIENKGIHVTADADVSVFAFNRRFRSADASIILPTPALGSQYYVASYFENAPSNDIYGDRFSDSELLVVGVEDNTRIRIKPTVSTLNGRPAGRFFEITLNQGEIYQVKAQGDLSGTLIETVVAQDECNGQKFAVFGGNQWTRISDEPCYDAVTSEFGNIGGAFAGDHLFEQMLPVTTWGRDFTVLPFETRDGGYLVRVMASRSNTIVTVNGSQQVLLAEPGDYETINTTEPLGLSANFPIQVAQFSKSLSCDLPFNEFGPGDPFMLMVSPDEQTFRQITFNALASDVIDRYFLNVITPTDEVGGVLLNGNSVASEFSAFGPNPEISVAVIEVVKGQDITLTSSDERGFIAYVYGFGPIESFGYVAGSGLSNIDLQIIATDLAIGEVAPFACVDSPLEFFADFNGENSRLTQFDTFQWDFGDGTTAVGKSNFHTYDKTGTFTVSLYAAGGQGDCFIEKTVTKEVQVTEVVLKGVQGETSICLNVDSFEYAVDGDLGNAFMWEVQGGTIMGSNVESIVTIAWDPSATVHGVSVTATNAPGCTKSAELEVFMNSAEPLDGAIVFEDVLCHGTSTGLARINITGGTAPYTVSWDGGNSPANVQNTGFAKGDYEVQVSDANGCSFSANVTIDEPDLLDMISETTTACMNEPTASAYLEVRGGVSPYTYIWDPATGIGDSEVTELSPGYYVVTVIDANDCELSLNLQITGHKPRVTLPNSFTPNGDNANDFFAPVFECFEALNYNMKVFNRWGTLIFNTNSVLHSWDGTYNGEPVESGTYSFKAVYSGVLNDKPFQEVLNGAVRLVR